MIELLSCPFCGGTDVHMRELGRVHIERFAQCYTCELSVPLDAWNRRATQPAGGEPVTDVRSAFENAWAKAMCNDEGVPGPKPLRSLIDHEQYRGGSVNGAWRWFQRGAQSAAPPAAAHGDEAEPSVDFAAWLIDHREGQVVTEEDMHEWLGEWYENRLAKRGQLDGD